MANVELKKDFKDGQYLYGDDLNNNFKVIEAGINANEENLQDVINQSQEVLRDELVDITTDRGWDWEEEKPIGTRVSFFKGNTQQLKQYEARPGQLLYNVETGETYLEDYGERIVTGSGNTLVVSDEEPTNPGTKVWIKPNELQKVDSTEVIDSLEGNETNLAPSVRAVKNVLSYSTEEQVIGAWMGKPLYRREFHGITSTEEGTFLVHEGNIKHLVFSKGYIVYFDGTGEIPNVIEVEIGKSALSVDECSRVLNIDGNVRLDCGSLLRNKKFELVIEYTKTTD